MNGIQVWQKVSPTWETCGFVVKVYSTWFSNSNVRFNCRSVFMSTSCRISFLFTLSMFLYSNQNTHNNKQLSSFDRSTDRPIETIKVGCKYQRHVHDRTAVVNDDCQNIQKYGDYHHKCGRHGQNPEWFIRGKVDWRRVQNKIQNLKRLKRQCFNTIENVIDAEADTISKRHSARPYRETKRDTRWHITNPPFRSLISSRRLSSFGCSHSCSEYSKFHTK